MKKAYAKLSRAEVEEHIRNIFERCQHCNTYEDANKEVVRLIKDELAYVGLPPHVISIGQHNMRLFSLMMNAPDGSSLTINS